MRARTAAVGVLLAIAVFMPGTAQAAGLDLVGKSDLGGRGLNGEVATVGNTAVVASGILSGGGLRSGFYSGTYTCPSTTVKVVDVSSPSAPVIRAEIPVVENAVANDVAALRVSTPSFSGDLLAVALVRCNFAGNYVERGVAYYDITNPAEPVFLGRYQADANQVKPDDPPCGPPPPGTPPRNRYGFTCASSQDQVSLVQRPGGQVLSLSTEPFSSASQGPAPNPEGFIGDLRIVDVTNPRTPTELGSYPNQFPSPDQRPPGFNAQPVGFSNNGCRAFDAAIGVGSYPDGSKALLPYFDHGLLTVDLSNPADPTTLGQYQYPRADRDFEGNAAYADFAAVAGRSLALVGESDWIAPDSSLRIDGPSSVAGSKFACEAIFTLFDPEDTAQVYRHPGGQIPGDIVYVGNACPDDPYPAGVDPRGKIALRDRGTVASRQGGRAFCSVADATKRLQDDGAVGVVVGGTSTGIPQTPSFDGDPTGLTIPTFGIDTGDATALRDALCPAPATAPTTREVVCGPGGVPVSGAMVDSAGEWGALRVVDVTDPAAPALRGVYRPPAAQAFPPPDLGVYSVHHAVARGSTAYVAAHANGVRVVDLTSANPTEVASFVPPDTADPTNQIPAKANVTGVDVAANGSIVISDVNSGLYVLRVPAAPPAPPAPAAAPPPAPAAGGTAKFTAKLSLARATIKRRDRVLDVLAPITSLASGRARVELHAAGRRFRFTAPVNSRDGRIRFRQRIPAAQAELGTGILTIAYPGDEDTRPQTVRLRAASQQAMLRLSRPTIRNGRLRASGTVSDRARGVVRVQIQYVVAGKAHTREFKAPIGDGRWSLNERLSQTVRTAIAQRTGTVHSYTLFTGYMPRRVRGEMRSFQVLGDRR